MAEELTELRKVLAKPRHMNGILKNAGLSEQERLMQYILI